MKFATRTGPFTFDDFCCLVKDGQKGDLIDGVIYLTPLDTPAANELFMWLMSLIHTVVQNGDLGEIYCLRVAFRLDDMNSPEPDIAFVSKAHLARVRRDCVEGPPDLAVEIVSPESVERDYQKKRAQYQKARVCEYWIVDEMATKVTLLRLTRGKYRAVRLRKGELHSQVLHGFWLRPDWLWQDPLPDPEEILAQIRTRQA